MRISVLGTGTMASGIAETLAMKTCHEVFVCGRSETSLQRAENRIRESLKKALQKNICTHQQMSDALQHLSFMDQTACAESQLIIEAVAEDETAKIEVLEKAAKMNKPGCIFSTCTSSLNINSLSVQIGKPIWGIHFFNPVPRMKLVELIAPLHGQDEERECIRTLLAQCEKTVVEVQDKPGFVVNRLLIPMLNEAIRMWHDGTASAEDIDTAMCLGANHPMGPLHLADYIGLDVVMAIMESIYRQTGETRYAPCEALRLLVDQGNLGRKTGRGIFSY